MFVRFGFNDTVIQKIKNEMEGKKQLIFYFDFKNVIFRPHKSEELLSLNAKEEFSSILTSMLNVISNINRKLRDTFKIKYYIYGEHGKSGYHINLLKDYKKKRQTDTLDRPDKKNLNNILHFAATIGESLFNFIPNINFVYSQNFEIDVLPYSIMKNINNSITGHVMVSCDKDNMQLFQHFDNVIAYDKGVKFMKGFKGTYMILNNNNYLLRFLKKKEIFDEYGGAINSDGLLVLYRSIVGDTSDDVKGVKGVGDKYGLTTLGLLQDHDGLVSREIIVEELCKEKDDLNIFTKDISYYENLENVNKKTLSALKKIYKQQDIIKRNIKIMDYEIIYNKNKHKLKELISKVRSYEKIKDIYKLGQFIKNTEIFFNDDINKINYYMSNLL